MDDAVIAGSLGALRPTLGAAITLNNRHGGLMNLLAALERYDLEAATDVVLAGLERGEARREETRREVYGIGMMMLVPELTRFAIMLANGGRAPSATDEEAISDQRPFG